jgi:hypothetical protein
VTLLLDGKHINIPNGLREGADNGDDTHC